jgi:hypothetical protein
VLPAHKYSFTAVPAARIAIDIARSKEIEIKVSRAGDIGSKESTMKVHAVQAGARRARQPEPLVHSPQLAESGEREAMMREAMIAEAAYYRAEARGFESGHELKDWLDAEREIDLLLEAERFSDH